MILILRRLLTLSVALGLVFALQQTVLAAQLLHYPAQPGATDVSQLDISGALDTPLIAPVLEDFHRRNPDIALTYRNLTTLEVYRTFIAGNENPQADVVMSSAMPWQYQLANNGYARSLDLANAERWPAWARWRQELFGITFEPVVIVYRKALAERYGDIGSHAELLSLLEREREALRGRVVTYDPARSGAGYTYAVEEARLSPRYWELVAALGGVEADLVGTTQEMLDGLAEGRYLIGYNLLGSYAQGFAEDHPELEVVIPSDYALVMQRLAFLPRSADNPEAARRFFDYLLSEQGQRVISERTPLGAVHPALEGPGSASALRNRLGEALRPIRLGPGLLATLDRLKREALLARWNREFRRPTTPADSSTPEETMP
ncbi:ABC transporter substrate-binding protein [Halomonas sp. McH1-25]|uniref:ABC transporter substrate-binding protein n=1 Tax=unclassified Halomonas TaxID=2609666 RepID=UPI001EF45B0D|nr:MULTISPECIES: ABC transporter substrate-binding protein [unclassified Halomonas]MCG7600831.1 ABC transporter substrate-binding protein [Halomonas sp. McH1-25]MCP1344397.1 ABC transporter substrate-binding protein [Halomonas sp. FL8]MCP1362427.1 ABC transporter substrate-binding protein [Halomonas sp. BBD45]